MPKLTDCAESEFGALVAKPRAAFYGSAMNISNWAEQFHEVYDHAVANYRAGERKPDKIVSASETAFLKSIGCVTQELFDFAEDFCRGGEPAFETVLLITSARRDFFLFAQKGQLSSKVISMDSLPPKDAAVDGIEWLPRIIVKARAKLRGEMPPELMFGCGGDRPFLRSVNVHPADFLREVWAAGDDDRRIVEWVKRQRAKV